MVIFEAWFHIEYCSVFYLNAFSDLPVCLQEMFTCLTNRIHHLEV